MKKRGVKKTKTKRKKKKKTKATQARASAAAADSVCRVFGVRVGIWFAIHLFDLEMI